MGQHPELLAVDHITITVRDMDAAKHFYHDILGLQVLLEVRNGSTAALGGDGDVHTTTDADEALFDQRRPHWDMIEFERVGGVSIDLIAFPGEQVAGTPAEKLDRLGFTHLAFEVRDPDAYLAHLESLGVEQVAPRYVRDPDGNLLQIQEPGHAERLRRFFSERFATAP